MNSQACVLCGKTLSRIRVGGGEDFCSREHRNQYRLRRGMDRLGEAIPTVIGRRELPKPLTRIYNSNAGEPRMATMTIRIRHAQPVLQLWLPRSAARMPKSEAPRECLSVRPPEAKPREFRILRGRSQHRYDRRPARIASAGSFAVNRSRRAVPQAPPAKKGLTRRVSLGVRFRQFRIVWQFRGSSLAGQRLVWTEMPHVAAAREISAATRAAAVKMPLGAPALREFRPRPAMLFEAPRARPVSAIVSPGTAAPRESVMPLKHDSAPATVRVELRREKLFPGFARLTQHPAPSAPATRIAAAPFAPQDPIQSSTVEEYQTR